MNNDIKRRLKLIYSIPAPGRKDRFLMEHRRKEIGIKELYLMQIGFISPIARLASFVIVILLLMLSIYMDNYAIWRISSFMPVLAVIALTENHKSEIYQMNELEMSARFSLKTILMVRMSIFGLVHSLILIVLSLLSNMNTVHSLVYLLVPYLITSNSSSIVLRHCHGRSAILICLVNSFIISALGSALGIKEQCIYSDVLFIYWVIILILMIMVGIWNGYVALKRTECFYGIGN